MIIPEYLGMILPVIIVIPFTSLPYSNSFRAKEVYIFYILGSTDCLKPEFYESMKVEKPGRQE